MEWSATMMTEVGANPIESMKNPEDALDTNLPPPDNEDHNAATKAWVSVSSGKPALL